MQAIIKMKAREEHNEKLLTESKKDQVSVLLHHKKTTQIHFLSSFIMSIFLKVSKYNSRLKIN
ncbi:hypothetical protein CEQ48_10165 [Vibrio tarriae]|uniref:Uncharacterized protein n=1 Tax=Vibrio tarriae TaxID=2014742 RepID=A0AAU8WFS5_9VIBR|nr:hypothetical protein CEQ48_10165 [Vibrio tarriae]EGR2392905.1 hypothetical protein [Vibrio cholerae]RBM48546.1 hypothetical protein DLR64_15185 [Vibrio tarriae]